MSRIIIISDTHVHPWSAFASGTGLNNDRMQRTLGVMRASLERARADGATWVHAADMIHTTGHVRHEVASAVLDLLMEFDDVPMMTIWGNHDSRGRGSRVQQEESFQHVLDAALPNMVLLDGDTFQAGGLTFTGLGAQPRHDMLDLDALPDADVCILHAQVAGASFPSGAVSDGINPDLLRRWPLAVVGDIHHPHVDVDEDTGHIILIPGSPEHHNFGDRGKRGWWVIDFHDGRVMDADMEESDSPHFLTVGSADDIKDDGNFYRVIGDVSEPLPENATAVASGPTTVEARDLLEGAKEARDIIHRWVELNEPPADPARAVRVGLELLGDVEHTPPRRAVLQRVEIQDFFSHEDTTWNIEPGVHAIVGHSEDFNSNGAGKSTLAEAVYWALYGKDTKGTKAADVVRWDASKASVRLVIDLDGKDLVVKRTRTSSSADLVVTLDDEPVEAETTTALGKRLEEMLGLDPDLFRSLGYFSQEDVVLLSRATDGQIKERLADLRGTAAYEQGAESARAQEKEKAKEADRAGGRVEALTEQLESAQAAVKDAEARVEEWDEQHEKRLAEAEAAVEAARARLAVVEERTEARTRAARDAVAARLERIRGELDDTLDEAAKQLAREMTSSYDTQIARIDSDIVNDLASIPQETKAATIQDEVDRAEEKVRKLEEKKQALDATIRECDRNTDAHRKEAERLQAELERWKSGACPTCGQPVDDQDKADHAREELQDVIRREESNAQRRKDAREELAGLKSLDDARMTVADLKRIAKVVRGITEKRRRIAELKEKKELVEDTARERAVAFADKKFGERKEALEERLRDVTYRLEQRENRARTTLLSAEDQLGRERVAENPHTDAVVAAVAAEKDTRVNRWRARLSQRRAERGASLAAYWSDGFGKSGVQSLLIDELAAAFNQLRGTIIPTLTRGVYDVQFSTTSRTQAGELRERIEFQVYRKGVRVPYANLSGGQRRRIDLGVLLTMTMAASRMYNIRGTLGIMVLDEVTSFLDDDGGEALAEVLAEYAKNVVPAVYVVSQEESLRSLFPSMLMVVQDADGVSRLEEAG